ncbi:probable 6-phosphogluconolactonase 4, chloroplastic [Andrographis paniculata]|uniref:probable 6-phosphogluconolactonase 4, chloroplastic n=1 Tax=Andrographis paniculata TaxID=175694 RepID=UPI0021E7A24E|nr:probable 6-phosphogluconolactonase 4, chloroplastic [Andrographis paniculata]
MASPARQKKVMKFDSEEDVAVALAKYTADLSQKYIKEKGSFSVVLSGGTLIDTLRKLTESPYKESIEWTKWLIFWVDERVVPLDDEESNYLLASRGFLSKVPIPSNNVYAINDKKSPEGAADDYEERVKLLVGSKIIPLSNSGFPNFDLMLLGMGPDGHVASLFPTRPQRYEKKRWVTFITDSPKPPPPRITFTFPVINSSSEIAMVITGADLADAVKTVLGDGNSPPGSTPLPAAEVSAENCLTWFLDKDAASKL